MNKVIIQTGYRISFNGHVGEISFPSVQSAEKYVADFCDKFPDVDRSKVIIYEIDVYELKSEENG